MSTPSGYLQKLIDSLRGGSNPVTGDPTPTKPVDTGGGTKRGPLEYQLDGYRQHVRESKAEGTEPMKYDEWIKQQPPLSAPNN